MQGSSNEKNQSFNNGNNKENGIWAYKKSLVLEIRPWSESKAAWLAREHHRHLIVVVLIETLNLNRGESQKKVKELFHLISWRY